MIRDAKPGSFNHRQVVGAIADGHGLRRWDLILFRQLAQRIGFVFGIDDIAEYVAGKLTGNVLGDIVDAKYKANTLRKLAEKYEIPTAQTVAIGDGANDLPMIKAAGLGIAYHAKPKVNEQAEVTIRHADLMGVFCILSGSMNQK